MSKSKSTKTKKKETNVFVGIVIGIFADDGPIVRCHNTRISKDIREKMVVHGMSAVHGGEDMLLGLFGPLPMLRANDSDFEITPQKQQLSRGALWVAFDHLW